MIITMACFVTMVHRNTVFVVVLFGISIINSGKDVCLCVFVCARNVWVGVCVVSARQKQIYKIKKQFFSMGTKSKKSFEI